MLSRKVALPTVILAAMLASSNARGSGGYYSGHNLVEGMNEQEKPAADRSRDCVKAAEFVGFVEGVHDALDRYTFCSPPNGALGEVLAVVRSYVKANPEEWHRPAGVLVERALKQAFPCKPLK
jgi:hypothetical protein